MCAGTLWEFSLGCSEDGPPTIPKKMIISLVKLFSHHFWMEDVTSIPKKTFCLLKGLAFSH